MNLIFDRKVLSASVLAFSMILPAEAASFSNWGKQIQWLFNPPQSVQQNAPSSAKSAAETAKPAAKVSPLPAEKTQQPVAKKSVPSHQACNPGICRIGKKLLWYIPDRCMDLLDCFSVEFGFGANIRANLLLTRWFPIGAGAGPSVMIGWNGSRNGGIYMLRGVNADFMHFRNADQEQLWIMGNYRDLVDSDEKPLHVQQYRDPLTFGFEGGCIGNGKFMVHLGSIADFIAGIFLLDFQDDDVVNQKK